MTQIRQVIELPVEDFQQLKETGQKILRALESLNVVPPTQYLTPIEFMTETKISRWKFDALREYNKLKVIQRGRKLYVPRTEVQRYFAGEMESSS
jgi:hypothetical protein